MHEQTNMDQTSVDTLIKIGGSITENGTLKQLLELGEELNYCFKSIKKFVVVPGGGRFAEEVRVSQKRNHFNDETAHWMAIHAMEQHALLLSHYISNSYIAYDLSIITREIEEGNKIPIISVLDFMRTKSKLPHSWAATSDAIAVEIANHLNFNQIIFVKDIDGVIVDNAVMPVITTESIRKLENSPLDPITPDLLEKSSLKTWIINGFKSKRIQEILMNKENIIATKIMNKKVI
ncbi:MAG: hypothetical protein FK734_05185 [Asgard group archaeon]|nr:hypothetical protein [Asgard group archaeon]